MKEEKNKVNEWSYLDLLHIFNEHVCTLDGDLVLSAEVTTGLTIDFVRINVVVYRKDTAALEDVEIPHAGASVFHEKAPGKITIRIGSDQYVLEVYMPKTPDIVCCDKSEQYVERYKALRNLAALKGSSEFLYVNGLLIESMEKRVDASGRIEGLLFCPATKAEGNVIVNVWDFDTVQVTADRKAIILSGDKLCALTFTAADFVEIKQFT